MAKREQVTSTIRDVLDELKGTADELRDELESWKDNLPENMQGGQKGDELQAAIDILEEAISSLENTDSTEDRFLDHEITFTIMKYPPSTYMSRRLRLEISSYGCAALANELREEVLEAFDAADYEDVENLLDEISEAMTALEGIEFPSR